ncbi:uncharacterized protein IL334_005808 [Kwoniella shivajii]|uniref:Major facilitator superfamily (MFS) profile domain-containing protein n=1 Tax=Kwoniella shivajii TaxID=564305 RepID=A0ABZ1D459_9TREE|nr:hypothetical protein IL334_005808 [Kwoniella shivajii]
MTKAHGHEQEDDVEKIAYSPSSSTTRSKAPESPLDPPYRSKYLSESENHDTFDASLPISTNPKSLNRLGSVHHAPGSAQNYSSGEKLARMTSGLSRMSSHRAMEMEEDLRRHISIHGKKRHSGDVLEDRVVVDLGEGEEEVILVDWLADDPENPFNWPTWRKYSILLTGVFITFTGAASLVSVGILSTWGTEYFHVSREMFILQLTLPMLSIAFTPMALAPLSEVVGRNVIYQVTSICNLLLFIPQCVSKNHNGVLAARFFQGAMSSVGNSMVGGTVSDMFFPKQRGTAMSVFSVMIFSAQASGIPALGWVGQNLGIRWSYIIQTIAAGLSVILNLVFLKETRADVLLSRRAKRLTEKTGKKHMCAADLQKSSLFSVMRISLVRPFQYLATEPIVTALSAWIGFAWSVVFIFQSSVILVFESYGFNPAQAASFEATLAIAAAIGFTCQFHQDHLYNRSAQNNGGRAPPEARLYWAAYGGLMFPLFCFIYAWTAKPGVVHWIVPALALVGSYVGVFMMYTGVYTYLADAYETYSSSAQASQSFARNLLGGLFPLFTAQMYKGMGYQYANTLVASVGLVLSAAPILLIFYGKALRKKSKVCSTLFKDE